MLVAADGTTREVEALADTGNPIALIVGHGLLLQFNHGLTPGMSTTFGAFDGGWLRIQIPELGLDEVVQAYGSDTVLQAVQASHLDFAGLVGLPLLKLCEYGGNQDGFWIRTP